MRTLTTIVLTAAVLPAIAQTPGQDLNSAIPTYKQFQAEVRGMSTEEVQTLLDSQISKLRGRILSSSSPDCYFIRQVNKNLKKPRETPEFVPLASAEAEPLDITNTDCLSDSIVRKPMR